MSSSPSKKRKLKTPSSSSTSSKISSENKKNDDKSNSKSSVNIDYTKLDNLTVSAINESRFLFAKSINEFQFNKKRVRCLNKLNDIPDWSEAIVYWITREARVQDNWSLLYAQKLSFKLNLPMHVCFCLSPKFLDATLRQYKFMLDGLKEVADELNELNINFHLLIGVAPDVLPEFLKNLKAGAVIADFNPLRICTSWMNSVSEKLDPKIPFIQIDSHNVVPCWVTSEKLEYAARTIRSKIHRNLSEFLTEFPPVIKCPFDAKEKSKPVDWEKAFNSLKVDTSIGPVDWAKAGSKAGLEMLIEFCQKRLPRYADLRNDPTKDNLSKLSPWFHFGHLAPQRAILTVNKFKTKHNASVEAFVEETLVRRELSDNFCFYNEHYDKIDGAWSWAKETLKAHAKDKRDHLYSKEEFEGARTHDRLWNASQRQLIREAKLHGFLRMYWAKKILEWTRSPEEALSIAIYLNDKYNLDGRDPNGYVGCLWSIAGIHDQGWRERAVFGKVRYMNYQGCTRKFDVEGFIRKYPSKG